MAAVGMQGAEEGPPMRGAAPPKGYSAKKKLSSATGFEIQTLANVSHAAIWSTFSRVFFNTLTACETEGKLATRLNNRASSGHDPSMIEPGEIMFFFSTMHALLTDH